MDGPAEAVDDRPQSREEQAALIWKMQLACLRVPLEYERVPKNLPLPPKLATWAGDPTFVTILGAAGSGKTWLAVRLLCGAFGRQSANGFAPRNSKPRFYDASLAIAQIQREMGKDTDGETFDQLCHCSALLLDDIGAERATDYTRHQLSLILRSRFNERRPTILTSNATAVDMIGDERIASRLNSGVVLTLKRSDGRKR